MINPRGSEAVTKIAMPPCKHAARNAARKCSTGKCVSLTKATRLEWAASFYCLNAHTELRGDPLLML